ncbi:transcription factor bHLH81-like isoform X2 [Miscanthus floridulus]|uniref:transcription factor bHLH81-like isoform X2 n=1 Tax=Miscanthus floridulus TaxID=154761 RepID=UPI0034598708
MNPPPHERGGRSRYGPAQQQQYPFVVDPTEAAGAAVRAFFPSRGAAGEPPPSPSSSAAERPPPPPMQQGRHHYGGGGGPEISLAHGHGQGQGHLWIHHHRYHQFAVEGGQDGGGPLSASLPRHSSSPPGFFSSPVVDNGFPSARAGLGGEAHHATSVYHKKMKSPMNLSRQGALSQFSEDGIPYDLTNNMHGIGHSEENITANNVARSFSSGFSIGSWEDSNSIVFSNPASKAGIHNNDDIIASISNSHELQFGVAKEMAGLLQVQQDQVPFRVRAKRGCATHPRSIAERERRTRISEKLRKLQALVPNMDKQTSTADMLDLAVDHIRGLQSELQALKEDKEKCTCRGNRPPGR